MWKYNLIYIFVEYNYLILAILGSFFGIIGGAMLIMVGLTPSDLYLSLHVFAAKWLFRSFFISSICYAIIIYLSNLFFSLAISITAPSWLSVSGVDPDFEIITKPVDSMLIF